MNDVDSTGNGHWVQVECARSCTKNRRSEAYLNDQLLGIARTVITSGRA